MLGKTLTGRYKILKQLGGGGFSHTFIAEDRYLPDRPSCVIKQLKPASSQEEILRISRELFDKEAKVLYRLGKHDCIPSLLAHFEEDEEFFLAQELIEGDVLTQEIKAGNRLGEQYAIDFLTDILPTLAFVHGQQVIHRDIKPSNLIRREADHKIVLIDFGAVKEVSTQPISQLGHTSSLVIGSPGYMPNEQYSGKTIFASDIYAIGMIAIQALTGLMPSQVSEDPITSEFQWQDQAEVTPTLAHIINKMVRFDFRQRYQTASEVIAVLESLVRRSPALTITSEISPSSSNILNRDLEVPEVEQDEQSFLNKLIIEVSNDLEMSEDPTRAKKLICLVCTGILENDLNRLHNFGFGELLQDLHHQFPTIQLMKESLIKAVKTIAVQKQRQYLVVAKFVFHAIAQMYQQPPSVSYQVSNLVIKAGSAQLIAPIAEEFAEPPHISQVELIPEVQPNQDQTVYAWVAHNIDTDSQQMRLKKLLFYIYQDIWESDLRQLNSVDWEGLLRELVSFMPTFPQLVALITEAVQRVSKPAEYASIGNLLLTKLEPLYPEYSNLNNFLPLASVVKPQNLPQPEATTLPNQQPFDPKIAENLFDQRLDLMRFTNPMRVKVLLFSLLYYRFDPDRDNWQELRSHTLDELLRQTFYAYSTFEQAESRLLQTARSLSEASIYEQSATYTIQAVKSLYDQLEAKQMEHPAAGGLPPSDDSEFTQPQMVIRGNDDDETCQFF